MDEMSVEEIQEQIFSNVSLKISERLPKNITLTATPNERVLSDLNDLKDQGLIIWDFAMKAAPWGTPVSNLEHMIKCIAYYGDAVDGYYCVGYAIGCVDVKNRTMEINFIEKRNDASEDLKDQFLPVIFDAFMAYKSFLNEFDPDSFIDKVALVGPVPGVRKYYVEHGFEYISDYSYGIDAMIKGI